MPFQVWCSNENSHKKSEAFQNNCVLLRVYALTVDEICEIKSTRNVLRKLENDQRLKTFENINIAYCNQKSLYGQ